MPVVSKDDTISVCIIGAGVSGVLALKACLEEGLQATCYEKSQAYGGLWQYRENYNEEFVATVMNTTILNTSKELSAFSDFPPPVQYPNYMPHSLFMKYMTDYVDHFQLRQHIQLNSPVLNCQPQKTRVKGKTGINWFITIEDRSTNQVYSRTFDKLIVAIGHHALPFRPTFSNQQQFKGKIIHTHELKDPIHDERFKNKTICVVGIGNSACDSAVDISLISKKCYLSSHRGNWFVSRVGQNGPYDVDLKTRWKLYLQKWFVISKYLNNYHKRQIEQRWPHRILGLKPQHEVYEHPPNVNDYMAQRIMSGCIEIRNTIERFTENGVIFRGHDHETPLDMVVLGTGYRVELPFFKDEYKMGLRSSQSKELLLYLTIYAPRLKLYLGTNDSVNAPESDTSLNESDDFNNELTNQLISSLAFVGFIQPGGSIFVCSEMQSRHVALVFSGKLKLPTDKQHMLDHISRKKVGKTIRSQTREFTVNNWIGYLDELAEQIGSKPNMLSMFFVDFKLWRQLVFGPSVPYQYRLKGPHSWPEARHVILNVPFRIEQGLNGGENDILYKYRQRQLFASSLSATNQTKQQQFLANHTFFNSCFKGNSLTIWTMLKKRIFGSNMQEQTDCNRQITNDKLEGRYSLLVPILYVSLLATSGVAGSIYLLLYRN